MKLLSLAFRNLLRNRRRSRATLLAMVIGLAAILLFGGYRGNVIYAMQTSYVQRLGHFQVQHKDYFLYGSGNPAAYGIPQYQHIIDTLRKDPILAPMTTIVSPRLQLGGIAGNYAASVSKTVFAAGVVVDEQNEMRKWDAYGTMSNSYPIQLALTGTSPDSVVIGTGVARVLRLCEALKADHCESAPAKPERDGAKAPDDISALADLERSTAPASKQAQIELLAANLHGAPNVATVNVVKAENQGQKEADDTFILMHLAQAQRLLFGGSEPQVTAIQIQLKQTTQMPAAKARLSELLATTLKDAPLEVLAYETLAPFYGQTIQFFGFIFGFISVLIGVIVLFTVGNTMSTAVVERTTEIGTLRAMGLRPGGIRRLFMCEGVLLGLIGSSLGFAVALILTALINNSGLTWTPPGYVYAYPLRVRVWGDVPLIAFSMIGLICVVIVSAWWPANRASKLLVVDALRHV
jgi:putative ABC transport system permease protein